MASLLLPAPQNAIRLRQGEGLSGKLLVAFHQACEEGDPFCGLVFLELLELEVQSMAPGLPRRQVIDGLVQAYEKLWQLCPTALPFAVRQAAGGLAH